ncbi:E3 ubiquitin-protein ligase NEURL3-like [Acanthopagrus schlegelii]
MCSVFCLGPLIFHCQAVGDQVRLSRGGRLAERTGKTFKNGLVFSSRPLKIQERIRLRVEKDLSNWHGALRVGFTNVSPSARSRPLPAMAIPNLTDTPGHWAAPVHESIQSPSNQILSDLHICNQRKFVLDYLLIACFCSAATTLPCGHQCLCRPCGSRVIQQFGSGPLCRHEIRAPPVDGRHVSGLLQASRSNKQT